MRTESNICPPVVAVEEHGDTAEVIFCENIKGGTHEWEENENSVYTFDEYRLSVPNRKCLLETVAANKENWLEAARNAEYNRLAAQIREKRNKLLEESDSRMCIDRIGLVIPTGSTFSAWLTFLKAIAEATSGSWAKYRQELRDITAQEGFPFNVVFPIPPDREESADK